MATSTEVKLLFFDTFHHDQTREELNLDLVQFSKPVIVYEVRVIPLKAQVEVNIGKGHRLGGTFPSEFKLDVFVNNLNKPSASTFEKLGQLDYKENTNIQLKPEKEVATDGLILKGLYRTVTFAVYGWFASVRPPKVSPPSPPPPLSSGHNSSSKGKSADLSDEEIIKPTSQQHPLDLFNEKLQQRQQGQLYSTSHSTQSPASASLSSTLPPSSSSSHKTAALEEAFVEALRKSPRHERGDRGSSRDRGTSRDRVSSRDRASSRDRGSSRDRASRASSYDSRDGNRDTQDRRKELSFPPEPKEPFDFRDKDVKREDGGQLMRPRDDRDKDVVISSRERSDSDIRPSSRSRVRDSPARARSRSRESSRERRDVAERTTVKSWSEFKEKEKNTSDREKSERELRQKEKKEQEAREKELFEKERIKEREEREKALKEMEELEAEKEKERDGDEKSVGRESEKEIRIVWTKDNSDKKEKQPSKDRDVKRDHDGSQASERPDSDSRRSRRRRSRDRVRSRSNSPNRCTKRPRSRQESPSSMQQKRSRSLSRHRSRSTERDRPPEPPVNEVEDATANVVGVEEEMEIEVASSGVRDREQPLLRDPVISSRRRVGSRRHRRMVYDADSQEGEGYEDISSDEEMGAAAAAAAAAAAGGVIDDPAMMQEMDIYEMEDEVWGVGAFNPLDFYLSPVLALPNPTLSCYQMELMRACDHVVEGRPREAQMLMDILDKFTDAEHLDRWVLAMEEIPLLLDKGLAYLMSEEKRTDIVPILVDWVMEGVDADCAMTQPDAAIKVRHLKSGIKLAGRMAATDESIAMSLLQKGVQSKLLSLVESQFIVFSVKHLALRALSQTTHFPVGVQWLLTHQTNSGGDVDCKETGYQRLVSSLLKPKIVKLTMSITALLRKIHLFEALTSLYEVIERVVEKFSSLEEEQAAKEADEEEEEASAMTEEDETTILASLQEVLKILSDPHNLIGQQSNAVPYSLLVENRVKSPDSYQAIFNIANACRLPESLLILLSHPALSSKASVYLSVEDLIRQFLCTHHGLQYLASHTDTTNGVIRCLLQMEEQEESGDEIPSRQLGLDLVLHLQVLQYIDQLLELLRQDPKQIDDPQMIVVLHGLHSLSFCMGSRDPIRGRQIVASVLSMGQNIEVLLAFLEKTGDEEHDNQMMKSICASYATQLLLTTVRNLPTAVLFEGYGPRLVAICEDSPATSTKTIELLEWLVPTKKVPSYDLDGLPGMITHLKSVSEEMKKVSPGLITVLRMIYSLVAQAFDEKNIDRLNEAKYRCVIVELNSSDCFSIFVKILQKASENQLKVWQQGIPYSSEQMLMFFSAIKPTLALVHACLTQLIESFSNGLIVIPAKPRDKNAGDEEGESEEQEDLVLNAFRDLTAVPVLLELHTVMCSVPTSSLFSNELAEIQKFIVDSLLAFTQEELQQTHTDEALSKSLWTLMLKELLKFTVKSPYTYMSGLLLLSELLPLPFPLHTKVPLTEKEAETSTMTRKLWSVHLQSSAAELFTVLHTLSATGCQPLQHLMRRVCWQIADLAAPSSLRITKILLDILMVNLKPKKPTQVLEGENKEGEEEMTSVRSVSIHTAKTLNLLAYLLSHPGIKAALLQLIGSSIHSEPKYKDFLPIMLQLLNQTAETPAEIQAQEGIVSMIQNLCDLEISMVNTERPVTLAEHLANSLPESILMSDIMSALLEHIGNLSQTYASILPCLRTLIMLTDHDYGFYHLKLNLEQNITTIHSLLNRINNTFSNNTDCLSTLSAILEFLRLLTSSEYTEDMAMTRTKVVGREDLHRILLWSPDDQHPLKELEALSKGEENLETILESITALMTLLSDVSDTPQEGDTNLEEIRLPLPATLNDLFSQRAVFTLLDAEMERLSPSYWLANPAVDEPDADPEVLKCDLRAICEEHLPGFNLEEELKKEASSAPETNIVKPKRPKGDKRKTMEVINIYRGHPGRKPFVAPMRGRGIMSHGIIGNRSNELFRTRTPNTSRPPSMHVDDFVKMEKSQQEHDHHESSAGQSQMPPMLRQPPSSLHMGNPRDARNKDHLHERNHGGFERGGGFPMPPRQQGSFFTPPSSYRREPPMHDGHSLSLAPLHSSHRGGSMGGQMSSDRPRMNFMNSRSFTRGSRQGLGSSLNKGYHSSHDTLERKGRNDRFSTGGGRGGRGGWIRGRDMGEHSRFAGGFRGRRDLGRHVRSFTK